MLAFLAGRYERLLWGAAAIVIAVIVNRVGVEPVLRARRVERGPHAPVQRAKIRLLDLQGRFGEQALRSDDRLSVGGPAVACAVRYRTLPAACESLTCAFGALGRTRTCAHGSGGRCSIR